MPNESVEKVKHILPNQAHQADRVQRLDVGAILKVTLFVLVCILM